MLELNKYSSKDDRRTWTTNASRATQIQKERIVVFNDPHIIYRLKIPQVFFKSQSRY